MRPDPRTALRREAIKDRQSAICWVIAGALVSSAAFALGRRPVAAFGAMFGVWFALYDLRLEWGVRLALRDMARGATPPRRASVVLLHDPQPRAHRPLLAVWWQQAVGASVSRGPTS